MTVKEFYNKLPWDMDGLEDFYVAVRYAGFDVNVTMDTDFGSDVYISIVYYEEDAITVGELLDLCGDKTIADGRVRFKYGPFVKVTKVRFSVEDGLVIDLEREE